MNLLYITFGVNTAVHMQAAFSIYSFLARFEKYNSVNIITDNKLHYQHLEDRVNIIEMTEEELKEWKGEYQFFWRIKIKAIEKICNVYPGEPVLYLDTDTFLWGNILSIQNDLATGKAFMHENEGALSGKKSKTEKKMWQQIDGKTFGNIQMQFTECMWNAGVVFTPNQKEGKDCELALNICDEMCRAGVTKRLIEQFSLSVALNHFYGLSEANTVIAHYWSAKEPWNKAIADFFLEAYFAKWSYDAIIHKLQHFDTSMLPVYQRTRNTNLRLNNMINKIFSPKGVQYLKRL